MQTITELNEQKEKLSIECDKLREIKKQLYSNMDIESPMSKEEKELNRKISSLFSEMFEIIKLKRKINKTNNN